MNLRPPRPTPTYTLFPHTTPFRSLLLSLQGGPAPAIDSDGSAELPAIQETARPATIDGDMLAPLTYLEPPTLTPPMRRFVDGEVRSGRCRPPRDAAGR